MDCHEGQDRLESAVANLLARLIERVTEAQRGGSTAVAVFA